MPISQDRMIAVINAAVELNNCYGNLIKTTVNEGPLQSRSEYKSIAIGLRAAGIDPNNPYIQRLVDLYDGLLEIIKMNAPAAVLVAPIYEERAHFKIVAKKNEAVREHMRGLRARRASQERRASQTASEPLLGSPPTINKQLTEELLNDQLPFPSAALLSKLHAQTYDLWRQTRDSTDGTINAHTVCFLAEQLGIDDENKHLELINALTAAGALIPDPEIAGEYTVRKPQEAL